MVATYIATDCYLYKQGSSIHVKIPRGEHGEVSEHLSGTISFIRKPSASRYDTHFDPSVLFDAIQAKLVPTYVAMVCLR